MDNRNHSVESDQRAVSEVLGQVLVFAIIAVSIGLIIATGFAGLEDTRDAEQYQNADRAFDVLADNMRTVFERETPSRATEIDLGDGRIQYGEEVSVNVSVEPENSETIHSNYTFRPIQYVVEPERSIVYEGGTVIRDDPRGGFVVRDPPFLVSDDQIHIPIIETVPEAERSLSGTTVLVRAESRVRTTRVQPEQAPFEELRIEITTPRAQQWESRLSTHEGMDCDLDSDTVVCSMDSVPDQIYVVRQRIRVSFDA